MQKIDRVVVRGEGLTVEEIVAVSRHGARVEFTADSEVWDRVDAAREFILRTAKSGEPVYGVTSGFGGMANVVIPAEQAGDLQTNLIRFMTVGAGDYLPAEDVRAAMLLRANSHLKGASGLRRDLIERLQIFLNEQVTPRVREYGSIGASGDLAPLATITGALIGLDPAYKVDFKGEVTDSVSALKRLGLEPLSLKPKEGLAMINGTSVMTGIASNCVRDGKNILALTLAAHALFTQALTGTNQSFHPFVHALKPHPGQVWAAEKMLELLEGSKLSRNELQGEHEFQGEQPIQDRYSIRCLPQYLGPLVDGLRSVAEQVEVEANSANDNPLIDGTAGISFHAGNFLGQYIGVSMDQFRYYLALLTKHLDAQIALLVAPEFNNGLSASLVGNRDRKINMGLKGLQISANSIMPLMAHLSGSLVQHFPTHAEQFNQNVNSQGFGSANLARKSVRLGQQYLAIALLFGVQGVDLRTAASEGHYDARKTISPGTRPLYEAVKGVLGRKAGAKRPLVWDDDEQAGEEFVEALAADIAAEGMVVEAVGSIDRDIP